MGGVLFTQAMAGVREELDQITVKEDDMRRMIHKDMKQEHTEKKDEEEDDEEYTPAEDASIDINQEIEDRKLAEKIGKYMDAVRRIKDDDEDDADYNPENDKFDYTQDEEEDASFWRQQESVTLLKNKNSRPKRRRRRTAPHWRS